MGNLRRVKKDWMTGQGIKTKRTVRHKNKSGEVSFYDVSTIRETALITV